MSDNQGPPQPLPVDELRKLAEKAMQGPWVVQGGWVYTERSMYMANKDGTPKRHPYNGQRMCIVRDSGAPKRDALNVPFIAACSPEKILALLDRLAAAESNIDRWAELCREAYEKTTALTVLVEAAYREGFSDGGDHDNLSYKYPPENIAWRYSESRGKLTGEEQTDEMPEWTKPNSYEVAGDEPIEIGTLDKSRPPKGTT